MMDLHVKFKNIQEEEKEHLEKTAVAKLEDLNRYFGETEKEGELTGECMIEHTGQHPAYMVHVTIRHRDGKLRIFEAKERANHADECINLAKNNLRNQIAREKD